MTENAAPAAATPWGHWQDALTAWQGAGVAERDPLRWHALQTLAQRAQTAPAAVQQLLWARSHAELQRWRADAQAAAGLPTPHAAPATLAPHAKAPPRVSPLAELTERLRQRAPGAHGASAALAARADPPDMPSLQGFREVWAQVSADAQLTQALARGPDNAGPLNSHRLVLRTLVLMRERSPAYLRHFLAHLDALLWLEQVQAPPKSGPADSKPARRRSKA